MIDILVEFILVELAAALALWIIYLLLKILLMLRKIVVTLPQLTLQLTPVTPPGQYDHGATVNVTGLDLSDVGPPAVPAAGATINLSLTDKAGVVTPVGSVQTANDGTFAGSFVVPATAAAGDASLQATDPATGATGSVTFTFSMRKREHDVVLPRDHPDKRGTREDTGENRRRLVSDADHD